MGNTKVAPPVTKQPEQWLEWMAEEPSLSAAIDVCVEADVHWRVIAYAVGKWTAEHRQDELAARIAADFERLEAVLPR